MATLESFDRYFLHLPPFNREIDFNEFWGLSIEDLKKIPAEPVIQINEHESIKGFDCFYVTFRSAGKARVYGKVFVPAKIEKPKVIIIIPDYNSIDYISSDYFIKDRAHFLITLRGHEFIDSHSLNGEKKSPGYMSENILEKEFYYVKNIYLDILRTIDVLRLSRRFDCASIGIIGKGLGASAAVFAGSFSDRVTALVLDTPAFCYLDLSQNISESDTSNEINSFLSTNKSKKNLVKKNLSYFDSINFSDRIKCPVLATVGLKDSFSSPECVLALFNHFQCDKTIEVYPEDGNKAGGSEQITRSLKWLRKKT